MKKKNTFFKKIQKSIKINYFYLNGKYFILKYKISNYQDVSALETALTYYSDLHYYVAQSNKEIFNLKYLFVLAHTNFLLSFHCHDKRKEELIAQARHLTYKGLTINNKHTSLIYLSIQLNA